MASYIPGLQSCSPAEAVELCRAAQEEGDSDAIERLDQALRRHALRFLQDRTGDGMALRAGVVAARAWARSLADTAWELRFSYLLELLADAAEQPAVAAELRALVPEGRAAELLGLVVHAGSPLRPKEIAERLGMTAPRVSLLLATLEKQGLLVRRKGSGRSVWVLASPRGLQLAELLPEPVVTPVVVAVAEAVAIWDRAEVSRPVDIL